MLHKSLGLTVLVLAVVRLAWRFSHKRPTTLPSHNKLEQQAASSAHIALYLLLFTLPLSGWWLNSVAGVPLQYLLLFKVPAIAAANSELENIATWIHNALGLALMVVLFAHIAGALKHHWLDKDATLNRMLPGGTLGKLAGTSITALAAGVFVAFLAAELVEQVKSDDTVAEAVAQPAIASDWKTIKTSTLSFNVDVLGTPVEGYFKQFTASINFDPENLIASNLSATISSDSVFTDNSTRDEMLPEPDWFATARHPVAQFNANNIRQLEDGSYLAEATLQIKDVTRELNFPFSWQQNGDSAELTAEVTINRLDYQLGATEFSDADTIKHKVAVKVSLQLSR